MEAKFKAACLAESLGRGVRWIRWNKRGHEWRKQSFVTEQRRDVSDNNSGDDSRDENGDDVDESKSESSDDDNGDGDGKESDSDRDSASEWGGDDESLWIHFVEDIVRRFKEQHEQKLQHYKAEDALELADEAMHPNLQTSTERAHWRKACFWLSTAAKWILQ